MLELTRGDLSVAFTAISSLLIVLILLISYYCYRTAFYSAPDKHPTQDEPIEGRQYEEVAENLHRVSHIMEQYTYEPVRIVSFDGTALFGRYYHLRDGAPVEILFHGYRSHAYRDCGGGHSLARKMGFNTLVVDQRAHGESGGKVITFGVLERRDCLRWAEYCVGRFGLHVPIILSGLSMGAATVLMATGLKLPGNVCAVMADCPYSAPVAIIEKVCRDLHYPAALCRPFIFLGARLFGRFDPGESTARDAVTHSSVPILLIHGEADHFVPCDMSREIAAACNGPVELHTFPGAGHGLSYITDPLRYERAVYEFLSKIPPLSNAIPEEFRANFSQ